MPGEYYIDRSTSIAYMIPPDGTVMDSMRVTISLSSTPLMTINGAKNLRFENLNYYMGWTTMIKMSNVDHVVMYKCSVLDGGTRGVVIDTKSKDSGLDYCTIRHTGDHGVILSSGNRSSLEHSRLFVKNCIISHFQRFVTVYAPGVRLDGVGNIVKNNEICYTTHSAILYGGNDHTIEYNDIHHVLSASSDAGM